VSLLLDYIPVLFLGPCMATFLSCLAGLLTLGCILFAYQLTILVIMCNWNAQ